LRMDDGGNEVDPDRETEIISAYRAELGAAGELLGYQLLNAEERDGNSVAGLKGKIRFESGPTEAKGVTGGIRVDLEALGSLGVVGFLQ
jgi:hypothetical protein